jgi:anaerobic selenocysteine-containing dehydrogenase
MTVVDGEPGERRVVKSFCRICTAVCGIVVEVEGDRVVKVRGDADHPLSHGYTCSKGRALPQVHHHPDRIEPIRGGSRPLLPPMQPLTSHLVVVGHAPWDSEPESRQSGAN